MKLGIIDLGSNTIRLVIYNWKGNKLEKLLNIKRKAQSIKYIHNDQMDQDGINVIIETLKELLMIARIHDTEEISIFATASLRNITNSNEAKSMIEYAIKFPIEILSGMDESLLGFEGIKRSSKLPLEGISVDIGGGSTEITYYKNEQVINAISIPIGSLSLYGAHVGDVLPTESEHKQIRRHIQEKLSMIEWLDSLHIDRVIGIGGSVRAILRLHQSQNNLKQSIFELSVSSVDIHDLIEQSIKDPLMISKRIFDSVPDRLTTVIPGGLILDEIMSLVHAKELRGSSAGLREGYLYERMLER